MKKLVEYVDRCLVRPGKKIDLAKDFDPEFKDDLLTEGEAAQLLQLGVEKLSKHQSLLYAQHSYSLLVIFQAMDAAGKDSTIKHVMSGINPQGCHVVSFKAPSAEELDHDYLWRAVKALPERGRIGIFNRSYYEEVLVVRVHPELLHQQSLPESLVDKHIWARRFEEINAFEKYLTHNGVMVVKIFLNLSKEEQKKRLLERIERPEKNWKYSVSDAKERSIWKDYMNAYEELFNHTSTSWAPWYVVPADHKWFTRLVVAGIIDQKLKSFNLKYPEVSEERRQQLVETAELLRHEKRQKRE